MIGVFLSISIILVIVQTYKEKNIGNMFAFLVVPYIILVILNNFVACSFGFYKISNEVLLMLTVAFIAFFLGMSLYSTDGRYIIDEDDNEARFGLYHIDKMMIALYAISFFAVIKLIYLFFKGDIIGSGEMGNGIVGHLLLISYSITPMVFLYWTYNKKKLQYLFAVLLILAMNFATFIKYNVIALVVSVFIFTLIYKKSSLKKAILLMVSVVVLAFCANYAIDFLTKEVLDKTSYSFYFNHLWVYCSGSLIYDNYIFSSGVNVGMSLFGKIAVFIFALPNMFLSKFFGKTFFPYSIMDREIIGSVGGQSSNVTDAIGYMFPSYGSASDIIAFVVFIFSVGLLFSIIYFNCKKRNKTFSPLLPNFLTFFVFLSFFGTFYALSGPWEIAVWSIIIPMFFKRKEFVRIGDMLK